MFHDDACAASGSTDLFGVNWTERGAFAFGERRRVRTLTDAKCYEPAIGAGLSAVGLPIWSASHWS